MEQRIPSGKQRTQVEREAKRILWRVGTHRRLGHQVSIQRLEIGIVTQARYIRETIDRVSNPAAPATLAVATEASTSGARAASAEEAVAPD